MKISPLISLLSRHHADYARVVPFTPGKDALIPLDFTAANTELTDRILGDTHLFTDYINTKLQQSKARYGIGGYGEHRTVYRTSRLFDNDLSKNILTGDLANDAIAEPRRLHLGTDIWGKPHTSVAAPIDGIVHSFAFNNRAGDYGTTIILSHQLEGTSFYTLYGHLSLNSIKNMQEGDRLLKGDIFAEFGIQDENGHWPPHLHFQIIQDLQGWTGDYPGVCRYSEREAYLQNSPDPEIILQLNQYT
ncbi:MAG: peptidoglycan DD-metalloendopeptidase family protein [Chitinophagaceae bacterium]|nr:peptidoglycan DD-metalloendopeptidase family protein [Chitinophagaceae bacterium]